MRETARLVRLGIVALTIAAIALTVGLLARPIERAAAEYNINGDWMIDYGEGPPRPASIHQTFVAGSDTSEIAMVLCCTEVLPGTLHIPTGCFTASIYTDNGRGVIYSRTLSGCVTDGGNTIAGSWSAYYSFVGGASGSFTGTGGNGDPKPFAPTTTATPTPTPTPAAVAGVAFDAATNGGSNAFDAWWLIAMASGTLVAVGGTAIARRVSWRLGE